MNKKSSAKTVPYISSEKNLPEITLKGMVLALFLSMLLAGANAYLGLFAGLTVSASIPAAVVSIAILRLFRRYNILENNAVQTAASAGESLAAGVIFTLPALVLMGYWKDFNYWETTLIVGTGGILGVLFTIPLRKTLIIQYGLTFPEGVATAEVLKTGDQGAKSARPLITASFMGGLFKLMGSGMNLWKDVFSFTIVPFKKFYIYTGFNLSPALIAVGYIVGFNISVLVFIGGVISWWIGIPLYLIWNGFPDGLAPGAIGHAVWSDKIRFLGVGAMVTGGIWALLSLRESLFIAFAEAKKAFSRISNTGIIVPRTEKDTPLQWVILLTVSMTVPVYFIYMKEIGGGSVSIIMTFLMILAGFLFSSVAGYMAGLVGSSNNPISGVTVATILTSSLLLAGLYGISMKSGAASAILIGAVVCCAASIAGDNMQDLKAGHLLGATPFKQQLMQMAGVIAAALVLGPILNLLNKAYGFGPAGRGNPYSLAAPQATLMQSVAEGVFGGDLPWNIIYAGMVIGIMIIILDLYLKKKHAKFSVPVLAVAVGLYLPFELDTVIMLGGLFSLFVRLNNKKHNDGSHDRESRGLLFASGLITGEAVLGILLAVPIVLTGDRTVMHIIKGIPESYPGIIMLIFIILYFYRTSRSRDTSGG